MSVRWRTNGALAVTLLLWASAFVAIRVALHGLDVAALSLGRLMVASVALAAAAPLLGVRRPARADLPRIMASGATGMAAYQLLLNAGERMVPAGTASLLVNTCPVFAALLARVLLREPMNIRRWAGIGMGFLGAAIIATAQGGGLRPSLDALLVLGAAFAQALFFVLQKPLLARYRSFEVTCYAMWSGTLLALPLTPNLVTVLPRAGAGPLAALMFLALAPSAIGFFTWAYAQARVSVVTAASSLYLVPILAIGLGWAILGETVRFAAVGGGLLALAGVAAGWAYSSRDGICIACGRLTLRCWPVRPHPGGELAGLAASGTETGNPGPRRRFLRSCTANEHGDASESAS